MVEEEEEEVLFRERPVSAWQVAALRVPSASSLLATMSLACTAMPWPPHFRCVHICSPPRHILGEQKTAKGAFSLYLNLKIRSADAREAPTDVQAAPYRRQGVDGTSCTAHYCLPDALPPSHDVVARRRRAITTAGRYREFAACQREGGRVGATEIKRDGGRREREESESVREPEREGEQARRDRERFVRNGSWMLKRRRRVRASLCACACGFVRKRRRKRG